MTKNKQRSLFSWDI